VDEAKRRQWAVESLEEKNEFLSEALSMAKFDLEKANEDLRRVNESITQTENQLEEYKEQVASFEAKNEAVGSAASVFEYFRDGLLASLAANIVAVAIFFIGLPRRRLETKKLRVEIAIKELEHQKMLEKD
jgi:chromosome segregation ATPase